MKHFWARESQPKPSFVTAILQDVFVMALNQICQDVAALRSRGDAKRMLDDCEGRAALGDAKGILGLVVVFQGLPSLKLTVRP